MHLELTPLRAFDDNYIWLLARGDEALVVDPGDAAPVRAALESRGLRLVGILVTHHHGDHVGGLDELRASWRGTVYAPAGEHIAGPVTPVREGQRVTLLGLEFQVIDVPGHTAGHVAYHWRGDADHAPLLFSGDTLFSAGCGRLFEGTPQQMHASLSKLAALPGSTRVCCAHEYTLSNLRFAAAVEPQRPAIAERIAREGAKRERGLPTLPSTIAEERATNPFLRAREPQVRAIAEARSGHPLADDVAVFAALREWKNAS